MAVDKRPRMDAILVDGFECGSPVNEWKCCALMNDCFPVVIRDFQFFDFIKDEILEFVMLICASRKVNELFWLCSGIRIIDLW